MWLERFKRQAPTMMHREDEREDEQALHEVARIHPALDRLRDLIVSATALDLRASAHHYWSDGLESEGERATISP